MALIRHFIDGADAPPTPRAHRPGLQPRHRRGAARGRLRERRRGRAGDRRRQGRAARLARDQPDQARRRVLPAAPPARERTPELAAIVTSEHGKVLSDAAGEISRGIENVEFAAGLVHLLKGERSEQVSSGVDVHSVKQPVGVVGCITPVQLPGHGAAVDGRPAPSPAATRSCSSRARRTPRAAVWLAKLFQEAGLPDGVLNVVHGDKVAVDTLLDSPDVEAVSFVGSTPIAQSIYERAAPTASACRPSAARRTTWSSCPTPTSTGPPTPPSPPPTAPPASAAWPSPCWSPWARSQTRSSRRSPTWRTLRIGDGTDAASEMGPLITREHRDRVASYVTGAAAEGATVVVDGTQRAVRGRRLLHRRQPDRRRQARDEARTRTRSSARCSRSCASTATTRPSSSSTPTSSATASRSSPATAAPPASSSSTSRSAWSASTCRSLSRWAPSRSAAGRTPCSATRTSTAPSRSTSTRAARSSPRAGPTPLAHRPRLPEQPLNRRKDQT